MMSLRDMPTPNVEMPQSEARIEHEMKPFNEETQEMIDINLKHIKSKLDVPYDELYHKEKSLIQAVIQAEKALKLKESTLPHPIGSERLIDAKNVESSTDYLNINEEHQFVRDQRKKSNSLFVYSSN